MAVLDRTSADDVLEISCPEDHEYDLDSDFEDEDQVAPPPRDSARERALVLKEGQPSENRTERSNSSLSSYGLEGASDLGSVESQLEESIKGPKEQPSSREPTVLVKFAAHRTWHAFVWYCYTGNLEFSQLKSQVEPGCQPFRITCYEGQPPTCSPKSMYRLADLVGNKELKAIALAAIKKRMNEANVLDESFSVFTSKYPNVQEVQLDVLLEHRGSAKVKDAFLKAMEKYGNTPHVKPVLSAFYDKLVS